MADENSQGIKRAVSGWIKAALTSVVGLLSGAVLMYLTPFVNNVIKPAKPVANFAAQVEGLNVTFNNRSTGATQGWWDFGDGSALEPFDPKAETIPHKYDKQGTYSVKLTLENLIGDESDRTAAVTLDEASIAAEPDIADFQLKALTPGERAPAAYQLKSKVKPGTRCILCYGDDRPLEILDTSGNVERLLYFPEHGSYTVRLATFDGKQLLERKQTVHVSANESADPVAKLLASYQAVRIERQERTFRIHCGWQPDVKDSVCPFRKERLADPGFTIASAEVVLKGDKNDAVRNPSVTIAPDKSKIILSGDLIKPAGLLAPNMRPPHWLAEIKVVMEHRAPPQAYNPGEVMVTVKPGTATLIPMQPVDPGIEILHQDVTLELWEGNHTVWAGNSAVTLAPVTLHRGPCLVTAVPQKDGFLIKIDAATYGTKAALAPPPATVDPPMPMFPPAPIAAPTPILPPAPIAAPVLQVTPPAAPEAPPQYGPLRRTGYDFDPLAPLRPNSASRAP